MPTVLQLRRGTTAEHSSFTGAEGEVTVNTTKDTLVVHDGSTQGGFEIALADLTNTSAIALTDLSGGTGVTYDNSTGAIAIGQAVGTGDSVTFAGVTAPLTGNVTGDVTGDLTGAVTGNVTGNVTGDVTGDLTGAVTGNVTGNVTGDLTGDVTGNVTGNVTGDLTGDVTGDLTGNVTGNVDGIVGGTTPAAGTFTTVNTSGALTVGGNLTVNGTTTTINSTTLTVDDKEVVLASGAADSAAADGAGISVDGASASILYDHTGTQWEINKPLEVTGAVIPSANETYDLGSSSLRWRDLYLSGNTLDLGGTTMSVSSGAFEMADMNVTGTLTYGTLNDGTAALTATVAELNKLDGVTATTVEINKLDGVTATTAELNYVDGVTSNIQTQINANRINVYNSAGTLLN